MMVKRSMATVAAMYAVTALAVIGLAGCGDSHKGEHCVAHQRELWYISHTRITKYLTVSQPVYHTVCTQWIPDAPTHA